VWVTFELVRWRSKYGENNRAVASGDIRLDLDPLDLLRALAGVANIGLGPDGERAAKRMVDILIAGVRTRS
jgi:hypothetical protein